MPPLPPASSGVDELADESDDSDLVHSADESVSSEHSWAERAAAPAAAGGRGRGRGRGGGRGRAPAPAAAGKGRGRGRGRGRGGAAAAAPTAAESDGDDEDDDEEAAPTKQSKYPRKNLSDHNFTLRVQYQGSELPTLHARFDGLSRVGLEPAVRVVPACWNDWSRFVRASVRCTCERVGVLDASIEPGEGFLGVLWSKLLTKPRPKKQSFYFGRGRTRWRTARASPAWSQHIQTRSAAALAHRAVRTGSRGAGEAAARAIWARAEHSRPTAQRGRETSMTILRAVPDEQYLVV